MAQVVTEHVGARLVELSERELWLLDCWSDPRTHHIGRMYDEDPVLEVLVQKGIYCVVRETAHYPPFHYLTPLGVELQPYVSSYLRTLMAPGVTRVPDLIRPAVCCITRESPPWMTESPPFSST
jgi:hypothetical protein